MSNQFPWGRVIDRFEYDFDGVKMEVTKYYGRKFENGHPVRGEYEDIPCYHCEEIRTSEYILFALVLAFIAHKKLGLNQHMLVSGLVRALELDKP